MASRTMMLALMGTIYAIPAAPRGMRSVSAASGPYAAELRASRPKIGIPAVVPSCSARAIELASGLPNSKSRIVIGSSLNEAKRTARLGRLSRRWNGKVIANGAGQTIMTPQLATEPYCPRNVRDSFERRTGSISWETRTHQFRARRGFPRIRSGYL